MDLSQITQRIAEDNLDAVEDAWMAGMEAGAPLEEFRDVLTALGEAEKHDTAQMLVSLLLSDRQEQGSDAAALACAQVVLPAVEATGELRELAGQLYRSVRGEAPCFDDIFRSAGLLETQSFRRALRTLDTCLACEPGTYLVNRFDNEVVRVAEYSAPLGEFVLDAGGAKTKQLEPKLLADEYDIVDAGDFRVLCRFRQDELGELMQKDVAMVLTGICQAHGGEITADDLKDLVCPRYIPKDKYSGWWNRARSAARRSEHLSIEGRNPAIVSWHPGGRSLEEEMAAAVDAARSAMDFLGVLNEYAREVKHRKVEPNAAFLAPLGNHLAGQVRELLARRPGEALLAAIALERGRADGLPLAAAEGPTAADVLAAAPDPAQLIADLPDAGLWSDAIEAMSAREDATEQLVNLLRLAPAGQLDDIVDRLRAAGRADAIAQAVEDAMARPAEEVGILLWLWSHPDEALPQAHDRLALLSNILSASGQMQRDAAIESEMRKEAYRQIRLALLAEGGGRFRAALEGVELPIAGTIKNRVERCEALTTAARHDLLAVMREDFYTLFVEKKVAPWLDEGVIWSSEPAFHRQEALLKEMTDVRMPEIARAIGAAAALGDLSENSEWENAVEEQRRLNDRIIRLQGELMQTRVLTAHDVPTDHVSIGARVRLRRARTGEQVTVTFLGPWDTDVPSRVYSYKTPLAQALLGKTPGETVTARVDGDEDEYVVEHVEIGLDDAPQGDTP